MAGDAGEGGVGGVGGACSCWQQARTDTNTNTLTHTMRVGNRQSDVAICLQAFRFPWPLLLSLSKWPAVRVSKGIAHGYG